jgi:hypothetical protein
MNFDLGIQLIYRGLADDSYQLNPSIARVKGKGGKSFLTQKDENLIFRKFKQRAFELIPQNLEDVDILAVGQHHGLPTRMMDWTFNPLVAFYFAVEQKGEANSAVYLYLRDMKIQIEEKIDPFSIKEIIVYSPKYSDQRIINQNGIFTIHPYPWHAIICDNKTVFKVIIENNFRRKLRKILNNLGINEGTIYPGIDGIAKHIKWADTDAY